MRMPSWKPVAVVVAALVVYVVVPALLLCSQGFRDVFLRDVVGSAACVLVMLYFAFPLALGGYVLDKVLISLHRRRVVRQMGRLKRFVNWQGLRRRMVYPHGTFILDDLTDKIGTRLWWTEEDICTRGPARPTEEEQAKGVPIDHPFYVWCHAEYLDLERGRALLVAAGDGQRLQERATAQFPEIPLVELSIRRPVYEDGDWWREYRGPRELARDPEHLATVLRESGLDTDFHPGCCEVLCCVGNTVIVVKPKPEEHFRNMEVRLPLKWVPDSSDAYRPVRDILAAAERIDRVLSQAGFHRLTDPGAEELAWLEKHFGGTPELQDTLAAVAEHRRQKEDCVANQDFEGAQAHRDMERKLINELFARLEKPH